MGRQRLYYDNGNVQSEYWRDDFHNFYREEGPVGIEYYCNGNIKRKFWCINNNRHRTDGPAIVEYFVNGKTKKELWYIDDDFHREDGPAIIVYDKDGNVSHKEYWRNGNNITVFVQNLFGDIPNELSKENHVLLKLSLPTEYIR